MVVKIRCTWLQEMKSKPKNFLHYALSRTVTRWLSTNTEKAARNILLCMYVYNSMIRSYCQLLVCISHWLLLVWAVLHGHTLCKRTQQFTAGVNCKPIWCGFKKCKLDWCIQGILGASHGWLYSDNSYIYISHVSALLVCTAIRSQITCRLCSKFSVAPMSI